MKLKVGDIVEFKNYEDLDVDERVMIAKDFFPSYGEVKEINVNGLDEFFNIVGSQLIFSKESVAKVIDDVDINKLNKGDEVLVKATVKKIFNGFIQISSSVDKTDVVKILKCKEPEMFIVKEDYYGMYLGMERKLVSDKSKAKVYNSCYEANDEAANMHLNDWEVIPYGA